MSELPGQITTTAAGPQAVTGAAAARAAAARGAQKVVKGGAPQKPTSPVSNVDDPVIVDSSQKGKFVASKNMTGVGGELAMFRLSMVVRNPNNGQLSASQRNYVDFEMAPARRSFADKQGQMVPGVGAGMEMPIEMSLAELKVPGSRPVMQPMGIAGEYIELVGAFIGYDEYMGNDGALGWDSNTSRAQQNWDAWEKSQLFAQLVRAQREVMLQLDWVGSDYSHRIQFQNTVSFRGHIKKAKRIYASPQRVYYYIKLAVNNREDINAYPDSSGGGVYYLPESLEGLGIQAVPADLADTPAAAGTTAAVAVNAAHDPGYAAGLAQGAMIVNDQEATYATNSVDQADVPAEVKTSVKAYIAGSRNSPLDSSTDLAKMKPEDLQTKLEGLRNTETSMNVAREKINSDPYIGGPGKQAVDKIADAVKVESQMVQEALKAKGVAPTTSKPAAARIPGTDAVMRPAPPGNGAVMKPAP